MMTTAATMGRRPILAWVLVAIFAVIAALIFVTIYVLLPDYQHLYALILIGILSLVFAVVAYFLQAMSTDPVAQRSLSWGFGGMGLALLLLSLVFGPEPPLYEVVRLVGLIFVVIVAGIGIAAAFFQRSGDEQVRAREEKRAAWASAPVPSAFQYKAAQAAAPPKDSSPTPPPPGSGGC